ASVASAADAVPTNIQAAVADPARPDADRQRDANRKPGELIAFAGIKSGDHVGDVLAGGGYFTRIFSKVVGDKGVVYAMSPPRPAPAPGARDFDAPIKAIMADAAYKNVKLGVLDPAAKPADLLDVAWTSDNYHDLHNRPDADLMAFNKTIFNALKPGGTYIVIDHAAAAGSGVSATSTLHRIDPAVVKSEVTAAGFTFVGESKALANPQDPHTIANGDPSVRGKTDQFVYKFQKPAR
ncbi:MAG: methyltransferase, partial [Pseudomonadota bacterium]